MRRPSSNILSRELAPLIVFVLLAVAGCGSGEITYPVRGTVTYQDGTPVTTGMVEFDPLAADDTKRFNARGLIHSDGTYFLTTFEEGDGAVPGRHRVLVQEPYPNVDIEEGESVGSHSIDPKYWRYGTSGLEFEVREGENEINIVVTRPGKK